MSQDELVQAINRAQDAGVFAVGEWVNTPEPIATIKHALDAASAAIKQATDGIPTMLELANEGGNSSPPAIQDAIVAVESAVGRAEIAVTEIARLDKIVQLALTYSNDLADRLKEVLQTAESN
jgi:hypothetical protein